MDRSFANILVAVRLVEYIPPVTLVLPKQSIVVMSPALRSGIQHFQRHPAGRQAWMVFFCHQCDSVIYRESEIKESRVRTLDDIDSVKELCEMELY